MIVSPTESVAFREMGMSSWTSEAWGCDCLWAARGRWYGVQRKALADLVASVEDGRLAKEMLQWPSVSGQVWLVIETGERGGAAPREMPNGSLVALGTYGRPWTGAALRALTYSIMADGVGVVWTRDEPETLARVAELHAWTMKARHDTARGRPAVPVDVFGQRDNRQYAVWLLSSLPGVGLHTAEALFDHFGGVPFRMMDGVTAKTLTEVPGVGRVTARKIMDVFGDDNRKVAT